MIKNQKDVSKTLWDSKQVGYKIEKVNNVQPIKVELDCDDIVFYFDNETGQFIGCISYKN
jgi:hypothetical protein